MKKPIELDFYHLDRILMYCPGSGDLVWRRRGIEMFKDERAMRIWNTRYALKVAGYVNTVKRTGYKRVLVRISCGNILAHRIAMCLIDGYSTSLEIDHVDGDATNNKLSNLRYCSHAENHKNVALQSNNTSGICGVYWSKQKLMWQARGRKDGKNVHLGFFDDIHEAGYVARKFRLYCGYSDRHGIIKKSY